MNKKSELDRYLYYMWNWWSKEECDAIFDKYLSDHIWNKWCHECYDCGHAGAPASFYSELDSNVRAKIVARAVAHYNK